MVLLIVIFILFVAGYFFLNSPQFGRLPKGNRLKRIKESPNYKDGKFQNLEETKGLTNLSLSNIVEDFKIRKERRIKPEKYIPSVKSDLKKITKTDDLFVWFGHSSYFLQIDGVKYLIDPVLNGYAAPVSFSNKSFKGTNIYTPEDIPTIDYLILTHDHYDHLDYETVMGLKDKINNIICPLGVGAHLEHWRFDKSKIIEKDWNESMELSNGTKLFTVPSRHFSGRRFKRNKTLWSSYILKTTNHNLFLGCDGGYGSHFSQIGEKFGPFDLAFIENGQYNKLFEHIHSFPKETIKIIQELKAKRVVPIHSAKFALSSHDWYEPLERLTTLNNGSNVDMLAPRLGEIVYLNNSQQNFDKWWKGEKVDSF